MVEMDPVYGMDIWHEPFWDRKLDTGTLYTSKLGTYLTVALGYYGRRISLFVSRRLDYYSSVASMRESDGWIAVFGSVSRLHD